MKLTQDRLKELLEYNKETGRFIWKVSKGTKGKGRYAGCRTTGYERIKIDGTEYRAHRLAWFYEYGVFPDKHLDHVAGKTLDNRITELRPVDDSENSKNMKRFKTNTSGFTGVHLESDSNKWRASICVNYKKINLGKFINKEDAIARRKQANIFYGFHENHGRT
jgi:hypothetical protein